MGYPPQNPWAYITGWWLNCIKGWDNISLFPGYLSLHIHIHPLYAPNQYIFLGEVVPSMPSGQCPLQTPRQTGNFLFLSSCHPFFGANIRFIRWRKVTALPCSDIKNSWPVSPNTHHSIKYAPSITGQSISTVVLLLLLCRESFDGTKIIRNQDIFTAAVNFPHWYLSSFPNDGYSSCLCGRIKPAFFLLAYFDIIDIFVRELWNSIIE